MCGRFTVTAKDTKTIADRFQVELEKALERGGDGEAPPPSKERAEKLAQGLDRYNVAPTQEILTVRASPDPEEAAAGEREARLMRWGLVPRWAKDLKVGYRMINAKAENLTSSKAYGPLVGKYRHRCLIVADGFYEWMKAEDPKQPRQPWRFTVDGGEPFAFAGICTRKEWEDEEDRGFDDGWLYSATIVTTIPNAVVAPVHNRMPAILPGPEAEAAWLRPDLGVEDALAMLRPARPGPDGGRAGQPEAEQGRQGDGGRAGAAGRAAGRLSPIPALRLPFLRFLRPPLLRLRLRLLRRSAAGPSSAPPACCTVALPALVVSVQETSAAGDGGRFPDRCRRAASRSRFGLPPAMKYLRCSVPVFVLGPFELHAFFRGEAGDAQVFGFYDDDFAAAGAEVDQESFRHFLAVDAGFRGARVGARAGRRRIWAISVRGPALVRAEDAAVPDRRAGVDPQRARRPGTASSR